MNQNSSLRRANRSLFPRALAAPWIDMHFDPQALKTVPITVRIFFKYSIDKEGQVQSANE
jgi:hypothetical protein